MKQHGLKLRVIAGTGFLRAYSGTLYLIKELESQGGEVEVWVRCRESELAQYRELRLNVKQLAGWPRLPVRLQGIAARFSALWRIISSRRVILTESTYLIEAAIAKKVKRHRLKLVHFCQELHLRGEYPMLPRIGLLNRLADVPDRVIDVEPNRARVRQEKLGLSRMPWVLRNTLPSSALPPRKPKGGLAKLAGDELPADKPILLHMGGIGKEKPLERLLDAVAGCKHEVFFLAFCNGAEAQLAALRSEAQVKLGAGKFLIVGPRKRNDLLSSAWEADIGIIDYSPLVENTSNQRYCAPTKLYEFMALGLAVLGSDNPSLREIIEGEAIGRCAEEGTTTCLSQALYEILESPDKLWEMKKRAQAAFIATFSYERANVPVIREVIEYFQGLKSRHE